MTTQQRIDLSHQITDIILKGKTRQEYIELLGDVLCAVDDACFEVCNVCHSDNSVHEFDIYDGLRAYNCNLWKALYRMEVSNEGLKDTINKLNERLKENEQ